MKFVWVIFYYKPKFILPTMTIANYFANIFAKNSAISLEGLLSIVTADDVIKFYNVTFNLVLNILSYHFSLSFSLCLPHLWKIYYTFLSFLYPLAKQLYYKAYCRPLTQLGLNIKQHNSWIYLRLPVSVCVYVYKYSVKNLVTVFVLCWSHNPQVTTLWPLTQPKFNKNRKRKTN